MLWWLMMGTVGAMVASDISDERKKRDEMKNWSEQKLHAYAGVKSHPKDLKCYAYDLAKQKKFERMV